MRYVVGYTPSDRGADAVALASAMARAQGAHLDLVYVVDRRTPYVAMNPEGNRVSAAEQKVLTAEREGMALVPKDLEARFHVRQADSHAAGLIDAAVEYRAGLIVVGAASAGLFKRYTIGSAANALLHASPVPVALAPRGYRHTEPMTRMTLAVGERTGAEAAIDVAVEAAERPVFRCGWFRWWNLTQKGTAERTSTPRTSRQYRPRGGRPPASGRPSGHGGSCARPHH